jgi:hypothetical protein
MVDRWAEPLTKESKSVFSVSSAIFDLSDSFCWFADIIATASEALLPDSKEYYLKDNDFILHYLQKNSLKLKCEVWKNIFNQLVKNMTHAHNYK